MGVAGAAGYWLGMLHGDTRGRVFRKGVDARNSGREQMVARRPGSSYRIRQGEGTRKSDRGISTGDPSNE